MDHLHLHLLHHLPLPPHLHLPLLHRFLHLQCHLHHYLHLHALPRDYCCSLHHLSHLRLSVAARWCTRANYGIAPPNSPVSESDTAEARVVCIARAALVDRAGNTVFHSQMYELASCRARAVAAELRWRGDSRLRIYHDLESVMISSWTVL